MKRAIAAGGSRARLLFQHGQKREENSERFRRELEACQALGITCLAHAMVERPEEVTKDSYREAIPSLREAAALAAEYGVTLALEFIKGFPFCGCLDTTIRLTRAVDRANVGVLLDTFHFYVGISKMADFRKLRPGELKFLHVCDARDMPRERLTDGDRVWLGDGILPMRELLSETLATGYEGYASMELFNRDVWEMDPCQVARKAYENLTAYLGSSVE